MCLRSKELLLRPSNFKLFFRKMAEAARKDEYCGFCQSNLASAEDVRTLSCSHSHCLGCILRNVGKDGVMRCPICRYIYTRKIQTILTLGRVYYIT